MNIWAQMPPSGLGRDQRKETEVRDKLVRVLVELIEQVEEARMGEEYVGLKSLFSEVQLRRV